jgi:hypothetical protein
MTGPQQVLVRTSVTPGLPDMAVSVAMCTYNGERYLGEQLRSIATQTRLPDELVICDDGSTDSTAAIAREFARSAPFPVRVFVNGRNLGFSKNFERAIGLCEGEVIALSDQDDVWLPEKLATFERLFISQPDVQLAFADAQIVDEALRPLGYTLWNVVKFSGKERAALEAGQAIRVLLRRNVVQGAGMAFRTTLRPFVLPLPEGVIHDAWIALLASVVGSVRSIDRPLILYRQHGANQLGVKRRNFLERMRLTCEQALQASRVALRQYEEAGTRLRERSRADVTPALYEDLMHKVEHLRCRISVALREPGWRRLMLAEIIRGRYHRYSVGWWSVGHDLIKCSLNRGRTGQEGRDR